MNPLIKSAPSYPVILKQETHPAISFKRIEMEFLKNLQGKNVLLYLSASPAFENYIQLPFDYIVLICNSFKLARIIGGKIIELPLDNSHALRLLHEYGVKVSCVVGVQDGCCEGGNFECVNAPSFFGRLSPVLQDKVLYITNHWDFDTHVYRKVQEKGFLDTHYKKVEWSAEFPSIDPSQRFAYFPGDDETRYVVPIERVNPDVLKASVGNITLMVSHSSVWDHRYSSDCIVHPEIYLRAQGFLGQDLHLRPLTQYRNNPPQILQDALNYRWSDVAMVPFLEGHYNEFVEMCKQWQHPEKLTIHFCHIENDDLAQLRKIIKSLPKRI